MKREITAVVSLLKEFANKRLDVETVDLFGDRLAAALQEKFKDHWYPDKPSKGQAYRCIRINRFNRQDPEVLCACQESGVHYRDLGLPCELTLWVDPGEVCCRFGENNYFFSVATVCTDDEQDTDVTRTLETSNSTSASSSIAERTACASAHSCCTEKTLNPNTVWYPKMMVPRQCHFHPHPPPGYHRAPHPVMQKLWLPPSSMAVPKFWHINHSVARHHYSDY